jgi:hypothetical protein
MTTVLAEFDSAEPARAAMIALESQGFDANDICLDLGSASNAVPTPTGMRAADAAAAGNMGTLAGVGALAGAAVASAIAIGVLLLGGVSPGTAVAVGLMIGVLVGGLAGALGWAFVHAPVNPDAFETYAVDPHASESVTVEVRAVDDEHTALARDVLSALHPRRLDVD